jgi:hypothetical protein
MSLDIVDDPIAIRPEFAMQTETLVKVEERQNTFGVSDFVAFVVDEQVPLFTVHGRRVPFSKTREIRDSSGLPLFEMHARSSTLKGAWYLQLPGRSREHILDIDLHGTLGAKNNLDINLGNEKPVHTLQAPENDCKMKPEPTTLTVKSQDHGRLAYEVYHSGARIASIRRLIGNNAAATRSGQATVWETKVSANVDLSIVSGRDTPGEIMDVRC